MSDTRVITADFDCLSARSVGEATEALAREGARVLAGGTDLLNAIKTNLVHPRLLVYILGIEELKKLSWNGRAGGADAGGAGNGDGTLSIGAAVRLADLEYDLKVAEAFPALVEAVRVIGGTQIRNMATLSGNLANASPGADTPPVLLVLGAQVEIAGPGGTRRLALEGFFTGPKRTVLEPGEMLRAVLVPRPPAASGAAFRRLGRVSLDIAKINCAAWLARDGERIATARVAFGSVAPTPVRAPGVEAALVGQKGGETLFRQAAELAGADIAPITDVRSTDAYRRQVAAVLLREALQEAWNRAGGR